MEDIRFKILLELNRIGHSTEEVSLNKFLSELRTYNGKADVGTICRAIKELDKSGLSKESPNKNVIENIITEGDVNTWKNPRRFIESVGDAPRIPDVYLYLTLEGKKFLIEWSKLQNDSKLSKFQRFTYFPLVILTLITSTLSIQKSCSSETRQEKVEMKIDQHSSDRSENVDNSRDKKEKRAPTVTKANADISSSVDSDAVENEDFVTLDLYGEPH